MSPVNVCRVQGKMPCTIQTRTNSQAFRQCVPLHPHSHHPSNKLVEKTCHGSAFRATQIGTNPADTLKHLIDKYVPALYRLGYNATEVVKTLTEISYFLTKLQRSLSPISQQYLTHTVTPGEQCSNYAPSQSMISD